MDGSRTFRKVAIACVSIACALSAMFLVWHLISAEVVGQTSTAQLGTVLALVLLPACAWGAWRMDRSWARRTLAYQSKPIQLPRATTPAVSVPTAEQAERTQATKPPHAPLTQAATTQAGHAPVLSPAAVHDGHVTQVPAREIAVKAASCPGRDRDADVDERSAARPVRGDLPVRGNPLPAAMNSPDSEATRETPRATHPPHRRRVVRR